MVTKTSGKSGKSARKARAEPSRQAVVVLGMHRSGTSALTRVLNLAGCDAARTLINADKNNQSGYWESDPLRVFNDRLLASAGSDWRDWHAMTPGWYDSPRFEEFLAKGLEILSQEYGSSRFFVFKDPRVNRIVPFWRDLLARSGTEPRVVVALRHPSEVISSLQQRDGMIAAEATLIWLRNILEAESGSRGLPRAFIDYDRMLDNAAAEITALQTPLQLVWPSLSPRVCEKITGFMTHSLRHHQAREQAALEGSQPFRNWVAQVWSILRRWSQDGEDVADHAILDGIRSDLDHFAGPLREVLGLLIAQANEQSAGERTLAEKDKEIGYLRGEAGKRGDAVAALNIEKKLLSDQIAALKAKLAETERAASEMHTALTDRERDHEVERAAREHESKAQAEALKALQDELHQSRSALQQRSQEADQQAEALKALQDELHQSRSALQQRSQEADQQAEALKALQDELHQSRSALHQRSQEADQQAEALKALEDELHHSRSALHQRSHQADQQAEALKVLQDELNQSRSALHQRSQEADRQAEALTRLRGETEELAGQNVLLQKTLKETEARFREQIGKLEQARLTATRDVETRFEEIGQLTLVLAEREDEIDRLAAQLEGARSGAAELHAQIQHERQQVAGLSGRMTETSAKTEAAIARLRRVTEAVLHTPDLARGRGPMRRFAEQRRAQLLVRLGLVDPEWYLATYADVRMAGADPALHFLRYGHAEGRAGIAETAPCTAPLRIPQDQGDP